MAYPFPTLHDGYKPDSSKWQESLEDVARRSEIEGGYLATRPKHTRKPRRTWSVTYQQLTNADKTLIDTHYETVRGGSLIFDWTNPQNGNTYQVRYKEQLVWTYVGAGQLQRWDCSFQLEQA